MDLVISQVKPAHQSIGLPTPSSLPARASHFPLDSDSEEVEIVNLTSESDRNALVDDNEGSELFELEREGEIIGSSGVAQSRWVRFDSSTRRCTDEIGIDSQ